MLYLHYDPITTALFPYFLGLVYLSIALWIHSELSQRDHLPVVVIGGNVEAIPLPVVETTLTPSPQLVVTSVCKSRMERFSGSTTLTPSPQPVVTRPEQVFQLIDDEPRQPIANKAKSKTIPTRGKSKPRARKSVLRPMIELQNKHRTTSDFVGVMCDR